ncbi:TIGR01459 family HAD-type hydrolase [Pontivivens insulae]|uniref:Acid sugar phosphatase n=1 Tax=Pontivivens insulae TaxID=1639689 RepID=A0A2R8A6G5_9RHOB|nr:TIGR01459 family HAD-type hydrolase [Pontivivens insulae]RED17930.1 HAD superfamily hydrolase (TIGR01459 family) [Pontivivens insulae]SPF27819.1 Acid sugar phosphatase [Pontivivens insulae]
MTRIIENLDEIAMNYDAVFCDLWGCLHNGVRPFEEAVAALTQFRDGGGTVLLLTNSPRPSAHVVTQLDEIGVARDLYQGVTSSGDAAVDALASGAFGSKVYHLGPGRDEPFFTAVAEDDFYEGTTVERVPLEKAESIVCTGLFDDNTETPDDYRETILYGVTKGLKMLVANPDVIVDRGDKRIYCAGAIGQAYAEAGGDAQAFGKPHAPIYALARRKLTEIRGNSVDDDRILCIGDGINTDIAGGVGEGLDTLFITGGLAAEETATTRQPDPDKLDRFLKAARLSPTAAIGYLR